MDFSSFMTYLGSLWAKEDLINDLNIYATYIMLAIAVLALFKWILHRIRQHVADARRRESAGSVTGIPGNGSMGSSASIDHDGSQSSRFAPRHHHRGWTHTPAYGLLVFLILCAGGFIRFWNLAGLPDGLQQDEASIGYEAYSLLHYGIDRNGYHFPVYPITWGSGGGSPLMIYLNVITTALFGSDVAVLRALPAFLGTLTLLVFFCYLKKTFGNGTALAGLVILALTPWHIILSRWSLDANTMPFWQILAAFVFLLSASKSVQPFIGETEAFESYRKQTQQYALASFLFGLCLYSYGSANFIIPVVLIVMAVWGVYHQVLSGRQLAGSIVIFLLTVSPLAYFYGVNYFGFPEISTRWISFPKFTSSHFGSVFLPLDASLPGALWNNFLGLIETLTFGKSGEVSWNAMPGYWILYEFTWPVTLIGIVLGGRPSDTARDARRLAAAERRRRKEQDMKAAGHADRTDPLSGPVASYLKEWRYHPERAVDTMDIGNALMRTYLVVALLFALFIQQDVNREVLLFLPLVYWNIAGLRWIWRLPAKVKMPKRDRKPAGTASAAPAAATASAASAKDAASKMVAAKDAASSALETASLKKESGISEDSTKQSVSPASLTPSAAADHANHDAPASSDKVSTTVRGNVPDVTPANISEAIVSESVGKDDLPDGIMILDGLLTDSEDDASEHDNRSTTASSKDLKHEKRSRFRLGHLLAGFAFLVFIAGAVLFIRDYYGGSYNAICAEDFMPGYGDAMVYADQLASELDADPTVYSTYQHVASPFMLTLYYTKYNPFKFANSVVWKDPDAEFRVASSFGHFVFGLPVDDETDLSQIASLTDPQYWNDVFVLTKDEAAVFDDASYDKSIYKDRFVVVSRKR